MRLVTPIISAALTTAAALGAWRFDATARRGDVVPARSFSASSLSGSVVTPLLSLRRLPLTVAQPLESAAVRLSLASAAAGLPAGSCLTAVADGQTVASVHDDDALIPASTLKLLTAAVALEVLGPDYRFETRLVGVREGATVVGDLWLVGGGDPLLGTPQYRIASETFPNSAVTPFTNVEALAALLHQTGVTSVSGGLVVDDSRFDRERKVATWPSGSVTPIGALVIDDSFRLATRTYADDPALSAGLSFRPLLTAAGITVAGETAVATTPPTGSELVKLSSAPLRQIVADLLTRSDNDTAELLLRELGTKKGLPGTRANGAAVVAETIASWGVPAGSVTIVDGSGLDRANRLTCAALTAVLLHEGSGGDLAKGLARPGRRGTLLDVLTASPIRDTLAAKTGTLTGVRGLAGFVTPNDRNAIAFVVLLNGADADQRYLTVWNDLAAALASYPGVVDATKFAPLPPGRAAGSTP